MSAAQWLRAGTTALMVAAMAQAVAVAPPPALSEAALMTPKALNAATLAVTRAGTRLVAVGERGTVLLSDDGGAQWHQARVPVRATLTSVHFANARQGWAAGHLGVILQSDDGGETWRLQFDGLRAARTMAAAAGPDERAQALAQRLIGEGADKPFFDLAFADAKRGFAVGAYNLAFSTRDGGATWQPLPLPNPKSLHLYGVRVVDGQVFIAGEQGLLLKSGDDGLSFTPLASPYKGSFFGLLATPSGALIAYGLRGNALRSVDQGMSWDKLETGVQVALSAATLLDDGALALLGQTGDVLVSRDDGKTFKKAPPAPPVPAAGLAPAPGGQLVLASLRGMRRMNATPARGNTAATPQGGQPAAPERPSAGRMNATPARGNTAATPQGGQPAAPERPSAGRMNATPARGNTAATPQGGQPAAPERPSAGRLPAP